MRCRWGEVWDEPVTMLHQSYTDAVAKAAGIALVIAPNAAVTSDPDAVLSILDALILAGGTDIDPAFYGAEPSPETGTADRNRDEAELALARGALARDLPVLGICRGMELLNIAQGGTLHQHLPARLGHTHHLRRIGTFAVHEVALTPGSAAQHLAGAADCSVRSHHHQAIDALGTGVVATGWDTRDGIIEAIEIEDASLAVGVQWHPEADPASQVIPRFVAEVVRPRSAA